MEIFWSGPTPGFIFKVDLLQALREKKKLWKLWILRRRGINFCIRVPNFREQRRKPSRTGQKCPELTSSHPQPPFFVRPSGDQSTGLLFPWKKPDTVSMSKTLPDAGLGDGQARAGACWFCYHASTDACPAHWPHTLRPELHVLQPWSKTFISGCSYTWGTEGEVASLPCQRWGFIRTCW